MNEALEAGQLVLRPGVYALSEPLLVEGKGVVLDGGGAVLRSEREVLVCTEAEDVVIKNLTVEGKAEGMHVLFFKGTKRVTLENVKVVGSGSEAGICFFKGGGFKLVGCKVKGFRYGYIFSTGIEDIVVERCRSLKCQTGLYVMGQDEECGDVHIVDSRFIGPGGGHGEQGHDGILLEKVRYGIIERNVCMKNMEHGIYLSRSTHCFVGENRCLWNAWNGIQTVEPYRCVVSENVAAFNGDNGIYIHGGAVSVFAENRCACNGRWGVLQVYEGQNYVVENLCVKNGAGDVFPNN